MTLTFHLSNTSPQSVLRWTDLDLCATLPNPHHVTKGEPRVGLDWIVQGSIRPPGLPDQA